jgi:arginine N-succinyltransferase
MSFLIREVDRRDLSAVFELSKTFPLLNLPSDEGLLSEKIERSVKSFRGEARSPEEAEYFFVVEDTDKKKAVGTSIILAKHGVENFPHNYFDIQKRERYSKELGIGFIHQVLKLCFDYDGPTEIAGLLVDSHYRGRPEKIGKQLSLIRFLYMAMHRDRFENRVLVELTAPVNSDGRNEFWEALGRRFVGLSYEEADHLSRHNKEFIKGLFPSEEIYTALLDTKARYVIGRVGPATMPDQHILESVGLRYLNQIDPFDGGPHYGAQLDDVTLIKKAKIYELSDARSAQYDSLALMAVDHNDKFRGCLSYFSTRDKKLILPEATKALLDVVSGDKIHLTPIAEGTL